MTTAVEFDAAVAEHEADPVVVRLAGRDWTLPHTWCAAVPLLLARWMIDGREFDVITDTEMWHLAELMAGPDIVTEWRAVEVTAGQVAMAVRVLVAAYGQQRRTLSGEALPPETGAAPSCSRASTSLNDGD